MKYEDNTLQIKEKRTEGTAPFFVPEGTTCSAADILAAHPNPAVLFYRVFAADEVFEGPTSWMKAISADGVKADVVAARQGKWVVFGILKRNRRVYTVVVDNAKSDTLMPVIRQKIMPDSIVYTDSLSSYDKLDVSGFIHYRINHSKEFADRQNHINGIGNFWNQAKRALRKYNGIDRKSFLLFLKECEFRFNFGTPSRQLKILRDWCGI